MQSLVGMEGSRSTEFFDPDISPKGSWRSLYKLPIEKWTADLQWRIKFAVVFIVVILSQENE